MGRASQPGSSFPEHLKVEVRPAAELWAMVGWEQAQVFRLGVSLPWVSQKVIHPYLPHLGKVGDL